MKNSNANEQKKFDCSGLKAYSGYFNDTEKLLRSSSGGGATAVSEAFIREGGVVFGACYSDDFKSAEFACIERKEDLHRLRGSKYCETDKKIFRNGEYVPLWPEVAEKLKAGRKVLFIGLGCDVGALKSFLEAKKIDDSNLFTIDLICAGSTFREVHRQYVENLEKKYGSKIVSFSTRGKKHGWIISYSYIVAEFENGKKFDTALNSSDYGMALSRFKRLSCYSCKFKGENHRADITIGDYWGLTEKMSGYNKNGVSIFIVRTHRGEELIHKINAQEFSLQPTDVNFAVNNNRAFFKSRNKPKDYDKFYDDLKNSGLRKALQNHFGRLRYFLKPIKVKMKKIFPLIF